MPEMAEISSHHQWMGQALEMARLAADQGEVPVGAVMIYQGEVIAKSHNLKEGQKNATFHAEILAIQETSRILGRWRLSDCLLYVTLEPCLMCAGAIVQARVDTLVFGASDPKAGAVQSLYQVLSDARLNHRPKIQGGILESECRQTLQEFFQTQRQRKRLSGTD